MSQEAIGNCIDGWRALADTIVVEFTKQVEKHFFLQENEITPSRFNRA